VVTTPTNTKPRPARPRPRPEVPPNFPAIVRPDGLARAAGAVDVPEPQHHHLPAWVRRAYGQARPILNDQLGALGGDARERYESDIADLTAAISSGKFSQAFNYPQLIARGQELLERQLRDNAEAARAQRALDSERRKVGEQLRDAAGRIAPDVSARLGKALRSAPDAAAIAAIGTEAEQATESARSGEEKRREREISRTRTRIQRSVPKSATAAEPAEDWQDVLRRLQEQMTAEEASTEGGR
jgi:hypothetical protein